MTSELFKLQKVSQKRVPLADATTAHDTPAYTLGTGSDERKLAELCQMAVTGCFTGTFYQKDGGEEQVNKFVELAKDMPAIVKAHLALYAKNTGYMKDTPIALLILLSKEDLELFYGMFPRIIRSHKDLGKFYLFVRSGRFGRRTITSSIKRAINHWLRTAKDAQLLALSMLTQPDLHTLLKGCHFKPLENLEIAKFGWLRNDREKNWKPATYADLPELYRLIDLFKKTDSQEIQVKIVKEMIDRKVYVRWDFLSGQARGPQVWMQLAKLMGPEGLLMNLNTLGRHKVYNDPVFVEYVAGRFLDPAEVARGKQFPYKYLMAYLSLDDTVPPQIRSAVQRAAELACGNVPVLPGPAILAADISQSMTDPPMGDQGAGKTSKATCAMVSAIMCAALWKKNPGSLFVPFNTQAIDITHRAGSHPQLPAFVKAGPYIDPNDSLLSIAERVSQMVGGGTNCSAPLLYANTLDRPFCGAIFFSDNQSWADDPTGPLNPIPQSEVPWHLRGHGDVYTQGTATAIAWNEFVKTQRALGRFTNPKYIGINVRPETNAQNKEGVGVLNAGGFGDGVMTLIDAFFQNDEHRFINAVLGTELFPSQILGGDD